MEKNRKTSESVEQSFALKGSTENDMDKDMRRLDLTSKPKDGILGDDGITGQIR